MVFCNYSSQKSLLSQQNKFSESKVKFREASNSCKRVFGAVNLHMLLKQKSPSLPRNLALRQSANSVLNKSNSSILPIFIVKVLSSASDKTKLFVKNFCNYSNLDNSGISLPVLSSRITLELHNIFHYSQDG